MEERKHLQIPQHGPAEGPGCSSTLGPGQELLFLASRISAGWDFGDQLHILTDGETETQGEESSSVQSGIQEPDLGPPGKDAL